MTNSDVSDSDEDSANVLEQSILINIDDKLFDQEPLDVEASFNCFFLELAEQVQVGRPSVPLTFSAG